MARGGRRREPTFEGDGELRAEKRAPRSRKPPAESDDEAPPRRAAAKPRRARSLLGGLVYWSLVAALWGGIGGAGALVYYGSKLPPIDQLTVPRRPPNIAILDSSGQLIANRGDTGGASVKIGDLPPYLPKAFVAIEDHRFYSHWGVDPFGIARALTRNIIGRGGMQGGSTLTQQLAKNLFLTQERTLSRKIQEAILALWLEHKYSKNQILELYLNRVYFGSGAYGVEAAAQTYYGHPARNVTLAEAAVLAGLMKAPSKLAPDRNPKGATERAGQVIAAMKQEGFITDGMARQALAAPARVARTQGSGSGNYAADYVMDMLDSTIGAIEQDIVVTTTLDHRLQGAAERALTETLDKKGGKYAVSQGAVVALAPDGAIRALVGGRNYDDSQFNRAVTAHRQPGSSFKPFVYLAGLEHGLTPDTVREDGPLDIKGWRPENYSREYFGPVTLTKALSLSLNTVAARVGMEAGPRNVARVAHRLAYNPNCRRRRRWRWDVGSHAAGARHRLCALRQWRHRRRPLHHRPREDRRRQAALSAQDAGGRAGDRSRPCGDDERDDGGDAAHRHCPQGGAGRLGRGGQDRHQSGIPRRLVRRLYEPSRRRRVARQ